VCVWVMTVARPRLKAKVVVQGRRFGLSSFCGRNSTSLLSRDQLWLVACGVARPRLESAAEFSACGRGNAIDLFSRRVVWMILQVYRFWMEDMYMKVKLALPINSNPGMVFPRQHFADRNEQLRLVGSRMYTTL